MLLPQTDRHVLLPQAVLELDLPAWVRPQDVSIVVLSGAGDMLALEAGAEGAGGGGGGGGGGCGGGGSLRICVAGHLTISRTFGGSR